MKVQAFFFVIAVLFQHGAHGMHFGVIGDFGLGGKANQAMTEMRSALMFNEVCARVQCNFTITVGDNMYMGNVEQGMVDSFEDMYDRPMKFFVSMGNHDNQGPQLQYTQRSKRWHAPSAVYTVTLPIDESGYTIQIFAIDTNHAAWTSWLTQELARSTARWKFVYGHHPMTGSGRHGRMGTVGVLWDLMQKYGVQVYFCGHDHILEYSINQGRAFVVTGAMSRGGMMARGRGGAARKFTLTAPGEFNKYAQDWPEHGFMTGDISPNVLQMTFWANQGGVHYETVVTHDWVKTYNQYDKKYEYSEPPPEVIRKAYLAEKTLPKGPGGGTAYPPSGNAVASPTNKPTPTTTPAPGVTATPTPTPTPAPPTYSPKPTTKPPEIAQSAPPAPTISPARYAVSTECDVCIGPTVNYTFTLFLDGAKLGKDSRVFLTIASDGCDKVGTAGAHIVDGTEIITPTAYAINFRAIGSPNQPIYVCYSFDSGKTYRRLRRIGSEERTFQLFPADSVFTAPPANAPLQAPTMVPQIRIQGDRPADSGNTAVTKDSIPNSGSTSIGDIVPIFLIAAGVIGLSRIIYMVFKRTQSS